MASTSAMAVRRNAARQRLSDLVEGSPTAGQLGSGVLGLGGEAALLEQLGDAFESILQRLEKLETKRRKE